MLSRNIWQGTAFKRIDCWNSPYRPFVSVSLIWDHESQLLTSSHRQFCYQHSTSPPHAWYLEWTLSGEPRKFGQTSPSVARSILNPAQSFRPIHMAEDWREGEFFKLEPPWRRRVEWALWKQVSSVAGTLLNTEYSVQLIILSAPLQNQDHHPVSRVQIGSVNFPRSHSW